MSKDLMISLLRKGNNGAQILEILDNIVEDNQQSSNDIQSDAVSYITGESVTF